jgi:hypothetical protein
MSVKLFQDNTEEKEASVLALALTLALFQPAFAEASAGAVPRTDKSCNQLLCLSGLQGTLTKR